MSGTLFAHLFLLERIESYIVQSLENTMYRGGCILNKNYFDGSTSIEIYDDYIDEGKEQSIRDSLNLIFLKMIDDLLKKDDEL